MKLPRSRFGVPSKTGAGSRPPTGGAGAKDAIRFGIFELDLRRRELRRKGVKVPLQHQPFEILRLLVAHPGDFVSREMIQDTLWPDGRFVDFERSINTAMMKLRQALRESASAPAYIETVPRSGYRLIAPIVGAEPKPAISGIAILPLKDLSGSPEGQYFVDGLTDALTTEMARRSQLRVVSRISMSRCKDAQHTVRQIAEELNVQAIVEGSILRSQSRIRISARLLDAIEDRHLWAQTYDRNLEDILLLSSEIATDIVSSVSRALEPGPRTQSPGHVNPQAYDQFLRGNFFLSLRAPRPWTKAIDCYQSAISLEPQWAAPHAALAEAHRLLDQTIPSHSDAAVRKITDVGERALSLDPDCALAHATLGALAAIHQWQWDAGQRQIENALRLDAQSSHVEYVMAAVLLHRGRHDEALRHIDAALSIDHSSLFLRSYRVQILILARRSAEALRESEALHEENTEFAQGLMQYAASLAALGRLADALPLLERSLASVKFPMNLVGIALVHWQLGRREQARQAIEEVLSMHREGACSPTLVAAGLAVIEENEQAVGWLQRALTERDLSLPLFGQLFLIDSIRSDPRVAAIFQQVYAH